MKKEINIKELGWNGDIIATLNRFGNYEWFDEENETYLEYDPVEDKTRHCGTGEGCFWTEWE